MSDITETGAGTSPDEPADTATPSQTSEKWSPATDATTHEQASDKPPGRKTPAKRKAAAKPKAEAKPKTEVKPKPAVKAADKPKAAAKPKASAKAKPEAEAEADPDEVATLETVTAETVAPEASEPELSDAVEAEPADVEPEENDTDEVIYSETAPPETFEGERIAKAIARAGIASRRDAEAMILEGRVVLNGKRLESPAVNVTDSDRIVVDGEPLPARERTRLWVFHKPRGLVTTARDPEGRQTVFEALPDELPRVVAVGRLDINTEGLLLLTNDGGLAKVIAHPDTGWLRRYRVRAWGDTTQVELDRLRKGVTIDGMEYGPIEATLDRTQGDNLWITLGLREGKNREVKRILEHLGLAVNRLIRLSFGPFQLGELEVGLVEEIRTKVLKEQLGRSLSEQAGVDFDSAVREPVAPFGSPKAASRSSDASSARPRRDAPSGRRDAPSGPAKPARVPTGGAGPGPRRSVWRSADEAQAQAGFVRPSKPPRRGADPKAERAVAAERGRERVGAISTGERRVVVERLKASPPEPVSEPHRRTRFRKAGDDAPRNEGFRGNTGGARRDDRPERGSSNERSPRGDDRARPVRSEGGGWGENRAPARSRDAGGFGGERGGERPRGNRDGAGDRTEGGRPAARPFRASDKPFGGKSFGGGGKSFGDKSFGGAAKPGGRAPGAGWAKAERPDGERSSAGRSSRDDRAGAGKEGGYKGAAPKGAGFKGAPKSGGFKAGGYNKGGAAGEGYKGSRDQGDRPRGGSGGGRPPGGSAGRSGGPSRSGGPGGGRSGGGGRPPRTGR